MHKLYVGALSIHDSLLGVRAAVRQLGLTLLAFQYDSAVTLDPRRHIDAER